MRSDRMEQILFVDACMRGELSRTKMLCREFLDQYTALNPQCQVLHRDLTTASLPVLTGPMAQERDALTSHEKDHPMLQPALEAAQADLILVGAPYWDLTFPAALKVYLEWASAIGVTFGYTKEGQQVGLCKARHLVFITTAGGPIGNLNLGYDYLKAWADMVGISNTHCLTAENLDIRGADVEGILTQARQQIDQFVKEFVG